MDKNKLFHILASVFLVVVTNKMVNLSDNLYLGLVYPEIYFPIVIIGLIATISINLYGAYKILEIIKSKL